MRAYHTAALSRTRSHTSLIPRTCRRKRELMIGDSSGLEVIRFKVEETLNELMHVATQVDKKTAREGHTGRYTETLQ